MSCVKLSNRQRTHISLFSYCVCFEVLWLKCGCGYITEPQGWNRKTGNCYVPSKSAPAMRTVRWNSNIVRYGESIVIKLVYNTIQCHVLMLICIKKLHVYFKTNKNTEYLL